MNYVLKLAILKNGQNQVDIAREAKIFESRLSKIVNGYIEPSMEERQRIAEALGVVVTDIFREPQYATT